MPFTFKLSQRLARMRCLLLLGSTVALAACEKPGGVVAPSQPGARIVKVILSPDTVTLSPAENQQFVVFGRTDVGDSVPVAATWRASLGSISPSGVYTAGSTPGAAQVTATSDDGSVSASASVTIAAPAPGIIPGDPVPAGLDAILVDARASQQAFTTLAQAQAGVPLTDPGNLDHFFWTTDMDGAGTHALGFQVPSSGGVCQDDGGHFTIPLPGNPTRVFFQWKQRLGRTATGGGLGAIGSFVINNAACGNAGRKEVLFARDVADLGGAGRIDYTWPGPAPAIPRFEGFYGTPAGASDYGPNQGWTFYPQEHVNETITQTLYVQAESAPGAGDGMVRLWINGRLLIEATGLALGANGMNRLLIPATFRAPAQDQTEYFWGFVVWAPR